MLKDVYPYYLANQPKQSNADLPVKDKNTGMVVTRAALADADAFEDITEIPSMVERTPHA